MGLFKKMEKEGLADVIRCDEPSYLIWKWHSAGSQKKNSQRENAIRWGSSLRVKDGEVAVFVYKQKDGTVQDFIEGPFDQIIRTANFPVLSELVGLAYGGETPFQAEIYFINLARVIQILFAVPFFDLYDPRFLDFGVPAAVRGKLTFQITDYREFIKCYKLNNFNLNAFQAQIRESVIRYVKGIVANAPSVKNIPVVQIEREIPRINDLVEMGVRERLMQDFGVYVTGIDIHTIELDKSSEGYIQLKQVTQDVAAATVQAQTEVTVKNFHDMQVIDAENRRETLRMQREEGQYAQHMQTQSENFSAFQMEKQAEVGVAGANALGQLGENGAAEMSGSGGFNIAGMMAGMALGGVVGRNLAGTINHMMGGMQQAPTMTPPPVPIAVYYVAIDGQAAGPYDLALLRQMTVAGVFTKNSLVWKQGMENWAAAEAVQELQVVFGGGVSLVPGSVPPPLGT